MGSAPFSDLRRLWLDLPSTNPSTIVTPASSSGVAFSDLSECLAYKKPDATLVSLCSGVAGGGPSGFVPRPGVRRWTLIEPRGGGTLWEGFGDVAANFEGSRVDIAPTATEGPMLQYSNVGTPLWWASNHGNLLYRTGRNIYYSTRFKALQSADVRIWVGVTNQTRDTMAASDNPVGQYAMFRYSTSASDSEWKCVVKDGTTQNVVSSGISFATVGFTLEVVFDDAAGNVQFSIDKTLASTVTANVPVAGNNLRHMHMYKNLLSSGSMQFQWGFIYVEIDK
jgi:hypothetical protein